MKITVDELMKNAFVISIDQKRIDYMQQVFSAYQLRFPYIFNGFSNNSISAIFQDNDITKKKIKTGAYNCSLSHTAIIKMAKCLNLPFVCIFEDDAYPCNDIIQQLSKTLNDIPNDAQCIILGWSRKPIMTVPCNQFDKVVGEIHGSHSYIVMSTGYDNYLNTYQKNQMIAADCILPMMSNYLHTYCAKKCLFIQWNFKKSNYGCLGYVYPNENGIQCRTLNPPNGYQKVSSILANKLNDSVIQELNKLNYFIYRPNGGNLGDMAIACSEFQLFDKYCFSYDMCSRKNYKQLLAHPFNLVFGGGGGWVKYWNYKPALDEFIKNSNLQKCIILPSSFYQCDDVINALDERFIVFCREKASFDYCKRLNSKATFIVHDDSALSLDISQLNLDLKRTNIQLPNLLAAYDAIEHHIKQTYQCNVGNFFRNDKEKANTRNIAPVSNFDVSTKLYMHGLDVTKNIAIRSTELMIHAIQPYSSICTDRLHVALVSHLLGKHVEMYDNSYGKLKGIYELSLKSCNNISFK